MLNEIQLNSFPCLNNTNSDLNDFKRKFREAIGIFNCKNVTIGKVLGVGDEN